MQPVDYRLAVEAYVADHQRLAARLDLVAEACRAQSVRTRLPLATRFRVFVTGRIETIDLGREPGVQRPA